MDRLLFYKKNKALKPLVDQVRFSYQRPYQKRYATTPAGLQKALKEDPVDLLFFFSDHLDQAERIMLRKIRSSLRGAKICLCGPAALALDAWQMQVFHFLAQPITSEGLLVAYRKYLTTTAKASATLSLKTREGLVELSLDDICYIKAAGNYSHIQTLDGKAYLQTHQLQYYEKLEESNSQIRRVHRSLIVNLRKIKKVGNKEIHFYHLTKPLQISKALEMKIVKILLGKA